MEQVGDRIILEGFFQQFERMNFNLLYVELVIRKIMLKDIQIVIIFVTEIVTIKITR